MIDVNLEKKGGPMRSISTFRRTALWDTNFDEAHISSNDDDDKSSDCSPSDDEETRTCKRRRTKQRENFGVCWEAHHDRSALE